MKSRQHSSVIPALKEYGKEVKQIRKVSANYENKHQMYTTYTSPLHLVIFTRKNFSLSTISNFLLHKKPKPHLKTTNEENSNTFLL